MFNFRINIYFLSPTETICLCFICMKLYEINFTLCIVINLSCIFFFTYEYHDKMAYGFFSRFFLVQLAGFFSMEEPFAFFLDWTKGLPSEILLKLT